MIIVIMPATDIDWSKEEPSFEIILFVVSVSKNQSRLQCQPKKSSILNMAFKTLTSNMWKEDDL